MKKFLKIFAIVIVALFLLLLILPFVFKGKIIEIVKTEANKNVKAQVDFEDVDLSLIRNFPNLAIGIERLSVAGIDRFEGDTLASMEKLSLVVDIMSVIRGDAISVKKVDLDRPRVHIKVLEDGAANYDIAVESETEAEVDTSEGSGMNFDIEGYAINDGYVVYDDASLPMLMVIEGLNHSGKGDFSANVFTLETDTDIDGATVDFDGIRYLYDVPVELKADIAMNLDSMKFTFEENRLDLSRLALTFDGWLAMPKEDIDMDLSYAMLESDLRAIMSLIPAEFAQDVEDVDATGDVAFNGYVRGTYNETTMPGFALNLSIDDGRVQYPDLPKSIENIQVQAKVENPQGADMNRMTVDVPRFHMEIGKSASTPNTVDATLSVRNPVEDPYIDTKVKADLDFGSFKDVVPMEDDFSMAGSLAADFFLKGALSSIENQRFDEFQAGGSASMDGFAYADRDIDVQVPEARVSFTPQQLDVETVKLVYENINMQLDGYLSNYVAYALNDTTLRGVFNFAADKIDANALMGDATTETEDEAPADTAAMEVIEVPGNLDVTLNATVGEILYDDLEIKDLVGKIAINNSVASLDKLSFNTLGGTVGLSGSYSTQDPNRPTIDFGFDISDVGIEETYRSFETIQKMAPIAKYASGNISSDFQLKSDLDATMTPVYETMNGRGTLRSNHVVLEGGSFLEKLSKTLKAPELARQEIKDIDATVVIEGGKVITEPFDVEIGRIDATISGHTTFEETIDYTMALKVPTDALGSDFNQMASGLLSQANQFLGSNLSMGEFINMDVKIEGDLYDPTIKPSFAGMEGSVKDQATEAVKEKIDEEIDKAKEKASEKAKEILEDAQKQADKVVAEAEKAAQRLRDEAEKQAQKLLDEAKNPLAKAGAKVAANKIREEADDKADKLVREARNQADKIMSEARKQAERIDE